MKNLLSDFQEFIAEEKLLHKGDRLLVALSGGLDSAVLCDLCHQAGLEFSMAHCNFQLRGEESRRDEIFAREMAGKYKRDLFVQHFDTLQYAASNKISIQLAAREQRYEWFRALLEKESFDFILTAHHLDDNIETSLMNFFRGTGIAGLRGILPKHGGLVRPLLPFSKEELLGYARQNGLIWVEDSSNESDKYARNYLRHHLIPLVETIYPAVSGNLAANIRRFKDTELLYIQAVELHKKKLCEKRNGEVHIPVLKLQHTIPLKSVLFEIVRDFTFGPQQLDDIMNLLSGDTGKYVQSPTHRILRNRKWLIITPNDAEGSGHLLIEETGSWAIQGGGIHLRLMAGNSVDLRAGRQLAQLDAGKIKFPLLFRRWKKGDYFYPLGMKKKKKLARFLIDHKMSLPDKEKVWVLEMNKKIIWVAGLRIDDRFRITDQTMEILHIEMRMT